MIPKSILSAVFVVAAAYAGEGKAIQESETGIQHRFLVCGDSTYIVEKDSTVSRKFPFGSRDGWVLPNGNVLIAASKRKEYPSGAIVEFDKDNKIVFEYKGTQSEVHSVQPLENGNIVMTEGGPKPRLLEITREGKIAVEFPLQCQIPNAHMQTRMARKIANGNYLAPHLLDKVVREYKSDGSVVNDIKTPAEPKDAWPFTAIRLENGHTLIDCTHGNMVIETDDKGAIVWQLENKDLPTPLLNDPCGGQRLANGNTVITSYGTHGADKVKMLEVTPDKKVVWTFKNGHDASIHEFQILDDSILK